MSPDASPCPMFATTLRGLGRLAGRDLERIPGVSLRGAGYDGRGDVLLFDALPAAWQALSEARLTDDIFVEAARTHRAEGDAAPWVAARIWRGRRIERALATWQGLRHARRGPLTFRVVVRVLQERSFRRTELRHHLADAIARDRPEWRRADPARLEVWVVEYRQGHFVAGLRITDQRMRHRQGRVVERPGALRPTVAAAMVDLAGRPRGLLLDPCAGSGTILAEARARGWAVVGREIDPAAMQAAGRNVPDAVVDLGDARGLDLDDGAAAACVSNLPFGRRFRVQGDRETWLRSVMGELARVTRGGGQVVLLAPDLPRGAVPSTLRLRERHPIDLLGEHTTIWAFERAHGGGRGHGGGGPAELAPGREHARLGLGSHSADPGGAAQTINQDVANSQGGMQNC